MYMLSYDHVQKFGLQYFFLIKVLFTMYAVHLAFLCSELTLLSELGEKGSHKSFGVGHITVPSFSKATMTCHLVRGYILALVQ